MRDYKKVNVWEKSHNFTLNIYKITRTFPKEEAYGITSQLRRASSSIPANIAEGLNRRSSKELRSFLYIAFGSANETQYFLELSKDLGYLKEEDWKEFDKAIRLIQKMLNKFINTLKLQPVA